ncbi:MAG: T9SS type A sorting domain-containing protein, partial [Chitinophagaceae bacterium]
LGGMVDLNNKDRFNGTIDIGAFEHYPDSVSVNISGPTSVCTGQQAAFFATAENEGTDPVYQWFVNGTQSGTGSAFSPASLNNNDVVSVIVTSSQRCIEKEKDTASIQITVLPPGATPTLSISSTTLPACAGSEIVFTANTNVLQPLYQWSVNGISSGTNSNIFNSNSFQNGDMVSLTVSGNHNSCSGTNPVQLNSDTITVTLAIPEVPTVQITATPGGDELPFSITVTNPLPGWLYTLYRNNISTQLTGIVFQNLQDTGVYEVRASGSGCYTSNNALSNTIIKNAVQDPNVFAGIVLYPVPVRGTLTVSGITRDMNLKYCKIFDAKGRLIFLKNIEGNSDLVINEFSNFPAGTYVVCFDDNKGHTKSYKVVKLN